MKSVAIIGAGITGLTAAFDVVPGMDKLDPAIQLRFLPVASLSFSSFAQQPFVFVVRPDPEPIQSSFVFAPQRAMARPDARTPVVAFLLKLKRAVPGILLPEFVGFARRRLHFRRQGAVALPEITRG
jgi:hypothetical protein